MKTPESLAALRAWLGTFGEPVRQRGTASYESGEVTALRGNADHYVEADVTDEEKLLVTLFLTRGKWTSRCACDRGADCPHVYAAALAWLAAAAQDVAPPDPNARPAITLAPIAPPPPPPPYASAPPPGKVSFREHWTPVLAAKLGRKLTAAEGLLLEHLAALFAEFAQAHGTLYPGALLRHGFEHTPPRGAPLYAPAFPGWWSPPTAPADPWALWQYIAYDYELAGRPLPEVFWPLTHTAATRAAIEEHLLQHDLATWQRALAASDDPLILVAKSVDAEAREVRQLMEAQAEIKKQAHAAIATARFALEGKGQYPDATFTLRLSYGVVKGYTSQGKAIPATTSLGGIFERSAEMEGRPPFDLPERWQKKRRALHADAPFNFVSTHDIIGGNSGSPVVNRNGEFVGIIFDGNIESLVLGYAYEETQARALSVHSAGILEALRSVYSAKPLVEELVSGKRR